MQTLLHDSKVQIRAMTKKQITVNSAGSFTAWGDFGKFPQFKVYLWFSDKQILETLVTTGEIINVLSACYHLLLKKEISLLSSLLQSQRQQRCVSVTVVFDKEVDECENVTGTNGRFNKMSAEWKSMLRQSVCKMFQNTPTDRLCI